MLALMALSSVAALLFVYIFMPALWMSIMSVDESLDAHESGLALVASRNPFRETGPPANMAKLILLRHKIQTSNRKRRSSSRQPSRTYTIPTSRASKPVWIRFGKPFGGKQYH
ncbi:hypothetical protein JR316_0005046 [Psilocybe cubensis]|uniref:Uncharacterized protein n=2 Tax=Psilocybe cubensis TaxID=181762 RepID=A0ACB8H4X7_PSICU|nr:hypothetical protein JR316_0005046 [Psilocybe cubensis]KAH9482946.1 hypothetical protein JR316_0005046 [Psilocybe cubensis]